MALECVSDMAASYARATHELMGRNLSPWPKPAYGLRNAVHVPHLRSLQILKNVRITGAIGKDGQTGEKIHMNSLILPTPTVRLNIALAFSTAVSAGGLWTELL